MPSRRRKTPIRPTPEELDAFQTGDLVKASVEEKGP
jgi:hypothetical protein